MVDTSIEIEINNEKLRYLKLLSNSFPNIQRASTEIINLQAILELPKGTEHFVSDPHGEAEAFLHILNNCSGNIHNKLNILFKNKLTEEEIANLSTLIYYPERKMKKVLKEVYDKDQWFQDTLLKLIDLCKMCASKYTRSKVRKALPKDFEYIIDELLHADLNQKDKKLYYQKIIQSIIDVDRAPAFIIAICDLIKRLVMDSLHVVGDLFDRGAHPDVIIDRLMTHHSVDIQWGNHDCLWMGAASGSGACIANVLNNAMKYNILDVIEDSYGINLLPLAIFAQETYDVNPIYYPKSDENNDFSLKRAKLISQMRKAINVIMFKMEGKIIKRRPEFQMEDRLLLEKIDYKNKTIEIEGKTYPLKDTDFPTIDPNDPYTLSTEEGQVMEQLMHSFTNSVKLQDQIKFIYSKGSIYKIVNGNLLFHGNIPLNDDGSFQRFVFDSIEYYGKNLLDYCDMIARQGYYGIVNTEEKKYGEDFLWWLWSGKDSPTCGRKKITTFERVLIEDEETHKEPKNPYYKYQYDEDTCNKIFEEFGFTDFKYSHIINGHMPVAVKKGESPIRANGKLIAIDGGFCKAYHHSTGIAGYTMFFNSWGIRLAEHEPFQGIEYVIKENKDIISTTVVYESTHKRLTVGDTDIGKDLRNQIDDLMLLLNAYRAGLIVERK